MKPLIRVTQLEKFRRYITEASSYDTEESVIATLSGEFKGNEMTRIGTAFHKVVEIGNLTCCKEVDNRFEFDIDGHPVALNYNQCQLGLNYRNEHLGAFHEVRLYKDYGCAIVTGCADMIDGIEIRDIKTKYSQPNDSDYINSCQWRYYLDIFNADVFHFDLFVFEGYKKEEHGHNVTKLNLTRYTPPITCYRYSNMEADNIALLNAFMDWVESKGLTGKLNVLGIDSSQLNQNHADT